MDGNVAKIDLAARGVDGLVHFNAPSWAVRAVMSSNTLPVCPKTGSTSPSLTVHLCLHTAPGNRECARRCAASSRIFSIVSNQRASAGVAIMSLPGVSGSDHIRSPDPSRALRSAGVSGLSCSRRTTTSRVPPQRWACHPSRSVTGRLHSNSQPCAASRLSSSLNRSGDHALVSIASPLHGVVVGASCSSRSSPAIGASGYVRGVRSGWNTSVSIVRP